MIAATVRGALCALLLPLAAAGHAQSYYPGDAVRVNGVTISYQRFNGFYTEYRNSQGVSVGARGDQLPLLTRLREEAMALMIDQELLRQAAQQTGIEVDPADIEAVVTERREVFDSEREYLLRLETEGFTPDSFREHVHNMIAAKRYLDDIRGSVPAVDDEELEAYYHANPHRLTLPEQVRVRHILLTWKPMGTRDDRGAVREQMQPILERARAGEDFAALAREFSDDRATRASGGDTGLFHRGQMVPPFEAVAFALEPGQISDPVETVYGVHILRLEERREPRLLPLDEIREMLREHVHNEKAEQAVEAEKVRLRAAAEIQVLIPLGERPTQTGG